MQSHLRGGFKMFPPATSVPRKKESPQGGAKTCKTQASLSVSGPNFPLIQSSGKHTHTVPDSNITAHGRKTTRSNITHRVETVAQINPDHLEVESEDVIPRLRASTLEGPGSHAGVGPWCPTQRLPSHGFGDPSSTDLLIEHVE